MKKTLPFVVLAAAFCLPAFAQQPQNSAPAGKIAVFVRNLSADPSLDPRLGAFSAAIAAQLNARGVPTVDEALALRSLGEYAGGGSKSSEGEINAALFSGASAAKIAEYAGADRVLSVAIISAGSETRSFEGYGISTNVETFSIETSSSLFDAGGGGVTGISAGASTQVRGGGALKVSEGDIFGKLFASAARSLADGLCRGAALSPAPAERKLYAVNLRFEINSVNFPVLKKIGDGAYEVESRVVPAGLSSAAVRIDGAAAGVSASSRPIMLSRGVHTITADIPDFRKVEESIYVDGSDLPAEFVVSLTPNDAALARWRGDMEFVQSVIDSAAKSDSKRILTEAEAEKLRGIAETFRNSNITVDLGFGKK